MLICLLTVFRFPYYSLYDMFIASACGSEIEREQLADVVSALPQNHSDLLLTLVLHLRNVRASFILSLLFFVILI